MPQETKAHPFDVETGGPVEEKHTLQGWIPSLATDDEVRSALDKAFDYRGDVLLALKDGSRVEGYIFDRRSTGSTLGECQVRLFPKDRDEKVAIDYSEIAGIEFTGRDTAVGKSFETWARKYHEKKAAGEQNIRLDPEKLE